MASWTNPFAKTVTAEEAAKIAKKSVKSSVRDLDKELRELQRNETQLLHDIKKRAAVATGPTDSVLRILAQQLVQIRQSKEKIQNGKASLNAMSMKATAMKSQVAMSQSIGAVSKSMATMNKAVDMKKMTKDMAEFNRQNEISGIREEIMDDALSAAFDGEGLEEEADDITNQVLAELGLEVDMKMKDAPSKIKGQANGVKASEQEVEDAAVDEFLSSLPEMTKRMEAL